MHLVLLCGLSGAGKSTAVRALEDIGYYCIDHLPVTVLMSTLRALAASGLEKIAIGVELHDNEFMRQATLRWDLLSESSYSPQLLVLTASADVLLRRYRESRRPHPGLHRGFSTEQAIAWEMRFLRNIPRGAHIVDTSSMSPRELASMVQRLVEPQRVAGLKIHLQSFGFKHGVPADADLMFDARCLPNPYYDEQLRGLTGKDDAVIEFFTQHPVVHEFRERTVQFVASLRGWYASDHRQCLHVALGCTGGQHRSVYLVETMAPLLAEHGDVVVRHREEERWLQHT